MRHLTRSCAVLLVALGLSITLHAQTSEAPARTPRFVIPPDINGHQTIVAPSPQSAPLRIAIYFGPGSGEGSVSTVEQRAQLIKDATVTRLTPEDVGLVDLSAHFDVIVFAGGAGLSQSNAIGKAGLDNVRNFVRDGGGYVGVCAGAYLACSGFSWGLGILDARTVSPKWQRGQAMLQVKPAPASRELFGDTPDTFMIRYANGPILKPDNRDDIPDYQPVTIFTTETALNNTPVGVQIGSPAMTASTFGKGRVFTSSPHPENTPGLENMIPRALLWSAGK